MTATGLKFKYVQLHPRRDVFAKAKIEINCSPKYKIRHMFSENLVSKKLDKDNTWFLYSDGLPCHFSVPFLTFK